MSILLKNLIAARTRIEKGWCQKRFARDSNGEGVGAHSPKACSWCTTGAVYVVTTSTLDVFYALNALTETLNVSGRTLRGMRPDAMYYSLGVWNDKEGRTKEEVLALFDKAIKTEEDFLTKKGFK